MRSLSIIIMSIFIMLPNSKPLNESINNLNLSSQNYILYSVNADEVIAEKNSDKQLTFASINKILMVITSLDNMSKEELSETVVIKQEVLDEVSKTASIAYLKANDVLTKKELLYGILLPSGADAVLSLSHEIFGSSEETVIAMNNKAKEIGMFNTVIKNTYGIDEEGQYSTLNDILTLLRYALQNQTFYKVYTTESYTLENGIVLEDKVLSQRDKHNANFIMGAKSGFTNTARRSLTSIASDGHNDYIFISTQAAGDENNNQAIADASKVYTYLFDTFKSVPIKDKSLRKFKIKGKLLKYNLEKKFNVLMPNNYNIEDFKINLELKEGLKTPIQKNEKIGEYVVSYQNVEIRRKDVIVKETIKSSLLLFLIKSIAFIFISLIVLALSLKLYFKLKRAKQRKLLKQRNQT